MTLYKIDTCNENLKLTQNLKIHKFINLKFQNVIIINLGSSLIKSGFRLTGQSTITTFYPVNGSTAQSIFRLGGSCAGKGASGV